jgi:hypothetical protein
MANGDKLASIYDEADDGLLDQSFINDQKYRGGLGVFELFRALHGQTGTSDGAWMDIRGWSRATLHFTDLGSGEAQIFGAVGNSAPGISNDINYDISGAITVAANADKIVTISDRLDFLRVAKTVVGDAKATNCVLKASH